MDDRDQREYERIVLGEFHHVGEATEEEVREQEEVAREAEEQEAALAAREAAEEAVEEWTGFAQEEGIRAFEEVRDHAREIEEADHAEHERQQELTRQLTEQLRAQVRHPEATEAITFRPTEEFNAEQFREMMDAAGPGVIMPQQPTVERFDVTAGTTGAGNIWTQGNIGLIYTPPRRYEIDFKKVNSFQDIVKVLEVMHMQMHLRFTEEFIKDQNIEHLVDRVDDRPAQF